MNFNLKWLSNAKEEASARGLASVLIIAALLPVSVFMVTFFLNSQKDARPAIGGAFRLIDYNGKVVTQDDFKGQPVLLFFGYTHCPDVCPTTLFEVSELLRNYNLEKKLHVLFVSVDPERDTPAVLKDYLSSFNGQIMGLSGDRAATDEVLKKYRVYSRKVAGSGADYSMDHTAVIYLLDRQMRFMQPLVIEDPARAAQEIKRVM